MIFSITLWSPAQKYHDEIESIISSFHEIIKSKTFVLDKVEHAKLVRGIYACDDISFDKIETKLNYMNQQNYVIRYLLVDFADPRYRTKEKTGKPLSMTGEDLKSYIRPRYKDKIKNYFPDIIIHTCDNEEQTQYVINLFEELENGKQNRSEEVI